VRNAGLLVSQDDTRMKKILVILGLLLFVFPSFSYAEVCAINSASRNGTIQWGKSTTYQKLAQPFTVTSACTLTAVGVLVQKDGSPVDAGVVSIYTDSTGSPGTLVETGTNITPAASYAVATSTFGGTHVLAVSTTYWVVNTRTGSLSDTNNYDQGVSNTSPPFGDIKKYDGATWSTEAAGYNFDFEVDGTFSGGGGGVDYSMATSSIDTAQQNLAWAFLVFFISMFGVVYLLSNKH